MRLNPPVAAATLMAAFIVAPGALMAQGTMADYQRAISLREKYSGLALNVADAPRWIEQTNRFYYRRTVKGGHEWLLVDGGTQSKQPAFGHAKLAAAIATAGRRRSTTSPGRT